MADTGTPSTTVSLETISGQITAAPHNTNYGAIETAFEAHTHDLVAERVKSIHATKKYALVSGTKTVTLSSGGAEATITFATDADQGDPSFTVRPRFTATASQRTVGTGVGSYAVSISEPGTTNPSTTACVIYVESVGGTEAGDVYVNWLAYGEVA